MFEDGGDIITISKRARYDVIYKNGRCINSCAMVASYGESLKSRLF